MVQSTRVSRLALIQVIDETIENYNQRVAEYDEAHEKYLARHLKAWKDEKLPVIKELRDLLSEKVKAKQHITADEVVKVIGVERYNSYPHVPTYSPPSGGNFELNGKKWYPPTIKDPADLQALRGTLEALSDEFVSPNLLRTLGFKDLAWVYRNAVANQPTERKS